MIVDITLKYDDGQLILMHTLKAEDRFEFDTAVPIVTDEGYVFRGFSYVPKMQPQGTDHA